MNEPASSPTDGSLPNEGLQAASTESLPLAANDGPGTAAVRPGTILATTREALGLTIDDIAARLKRQARQIAAVESQDWASLPTGANLRGLVRTYAQSLELDPAPLLDALPEAEAAVPALYLSSTISRPLVRTALRTGHRPMLIGVVIVLLCGVAAAVLLMSETGLPWIQRFSLATLTGTASGGDTAKPSVPLSPLPLAPVIGQSPASDTPPAAPPTSNASVADLPPMSATAPAAAAPALPVVPASGGTSSPVAAIDGKPPEIRLSFAKTSWFRFARRDGTIVTEGLADPGSVRDFDLRAPLILTLGYAPGTTLEVRGHRIDVKPNLRGDVARIEIK